MLKQSQGAMLIWANVPSGAERELNEWYTRQHLYERSSIAGVLRGRRFESGDAGERFLVIYEAQAAAVFASDAYLSSVNNPLPRTVSVVSGFSDTVRTIHGVADRHGDDGGVVATLRISLAGDAARPLHADIPSCKAITLRDGIVGATLFVEDGVVSSLPNTEKDIRTGEDERCAAIVVIEALDFSSAKREADSIAEMLVQRGYGCRTGLYRHLSTKYHGTDRDF